MLIAVSLKAEVRQEIHFGEEMKNRENSFVPSEYL